MVTLNYQDEHTLLRDEVRRWLAERCPIATVRELTEDPQGDALSHWRELADLGWLGLTIPASHGGSGLGLTHLVVLCEETGRTLLPAPMLTTTLAALAIAYGGSDEQRARWLPRLAAGELVATLAHVEPNGAWTFAETAAVRSRGRLSGEKHHVWSVVNANLLLVPFRDDASPITRLAALDTTASGLTVDPHLGLDATRRSGCVRFRDVTIDDRAVLPASADEIFAYLVPRACAALAAEMVGGADALLTMTAAYAAQRIQFGRPIGSFQAVKHPLVNVLIAVEHTRSLVYAAAAALDAGTDDAELLARMAKAQASDTYVFAASRAVQLHGGFGFTIDCDAHLYLKRANATRPAFGDGPHHRRWIAERLISQS